MKRLLKMFAGLAALTLCLSSCSGILLSRTAEQLGGAMSELEDTLEQIGENLSENRLDINNAKQHYWQVLDADGGELYVIDELTQTEALDGLLLNSSDQSDSWEKTAEKPLYSYVFWQEKTLKAGQSPEAERDYEKLLQFDVYEGSDTIKLDVLPSAAPLLPGLGDDALLSFALTLSEDDAEALQNPAQFAE